MLRTHFELLGSLINLELVLLYRVCDLVLLVVLFLFCLMSGLFLKRLDNTLFLEICTGQDCRNAALKEATCAYGQHIVEVLGNMTN
jgi:hypothetical protein